MNTVFQSLVLNKITYAIRSPVLFWLKQQIDGLQATLNKAKKWCLVSVLCNLRDILENQDYRLFNQIVTDPQHCLNSILTVATITSSPVVDTMDINSRF